jgi:uncharacterized protein (TIGR00251 family)
MRLKITVQPNSKAESFVLKDGQIKIRLRAKAVDGAANKALVIFLAKQFSIPRSSVILITGQKSRHKVVEVPDSVKF